MRVEVTTTPQVPTSARPLPVAVVWPSTKPGLGAQPPVSKNCGLIRTVSLFQTASSGGFSMLLVWWPWSVKPPDIV